jgi:hypothetical protein
MSGDSITQWSQACVDANAVVGRRGTSGPVEDDLGTRISSEKLRQAYTGYCKDQGLRAVNSVTFGKACADLFGSRQRLCAETDQNIKQRPWGYDVPSGEKWQRKIDERLGIQS